MEICTIPLESQGGEGFLSNWSSKDHGGPTSDLKNQVMTVGTSLWVKRLIPATWSAI